MGDFATFVGESNQRRAGQGHWALISGVDASGRAECMIGSKADSSGEASRVAYDACKKQFDSCFIFATSDGLSDWARKVSDSYAAGAIKGT